VKKTALLLLVVGLAAALNAGAQISTSDSAATPAPAPAPVLYTPGYTPSAQPSLDIGNAPTAETHVPESTTLILGCIMLVPLVVSLVRVFRRRHVLS
jgi:hypothetical protein